MNNMNPEQLAITSIKARGDSRWPEIISAIAPTLTFAVNKVGRHVPCPMHGGKDGLRAFPDFYKTGGVVCNTCGVFPNGILAIAWINGWKTKQTIEVVKNYLDQNVVSALPELNQQLIHEPPKKDQQEWEDGITQIFNDCIPLTDPKAGLARRYLKHRGVELDAYPDNLIFNNFLPYHQKGQPVAYCPALIAIVENNHGLTSLHRTYLSHDGKKADVVSPKKLYPPLSKGATKGSSIRLYEPDETLAVTEGVETALAVHAAIGTPVWASISAGNMPYIEIPDTVRHVDIWADNDLFSKTGEKAARKLADRLKKMGITTEIFLPGAKYAAPNAKSVDWLDVFGKGGEDGKI